MNIYAISSLTGCLINVLIGLFVFLKNPNRSINRLFGLFTVAIFLWLSGCFVQSLTLVKNVALFWDRILYLGVPLAQAVSLHLYLTIIEAKNKSKIIKFSYLVAVIFAIINLLPFKYRVILIKDVARIYDFRFIAVPAKLWFVLVIFAIFCAYYGIFNVYKALKKSSGIKRNQYKYLLLAYILMVTAGSLYFLLVLNVKTPPIDNFLIVLFGLITAYAIVRHHLMEIEVLIKKTVVFAGMFAFVFGVVVAIAMLVAQLLGGANNLLALAISALIITFSLRPLENWLINATDKFLFQKKYEYKQIIKTLIKKWVFDCATIR